MSDPRDRFDLTPQQYHAGLDKLWAALKITGPQDEDVFTLAAEAIVNARDIIAKLQTTADGVPVVEGDTVFSIEADGSIYEGELRWWGTRGPAKLGMDGGYRNELRIWMTSYHEPKDCYSTHEAAESTQSLARR